MPEDNTVLLKLLYLLFIPNLLELPLKVPLKDGQNHGTEQRLIYPCKGFTIIF